MIEGCHPPITWNGSFNPDKARVFDDTYQTINFKTYISLRVYPRNSFPHVLIHFCEEGINKCL